MSHFANNILWGNSHNVLLCDEVINQRYYHITILTNKIYVLFLVLVMRRESPFFLHHAFMYFCTFSPLSMCN